MLVPVLLIVLGMAPYADAQVSTASGVTAADRDFALKYLEETRQKFLKSIDGLSDTQWTFKAGPDRWSIAEVAEHIAVSEGTILQLVTAKIMSAPPAPPAADRMPDQKMIDAIVDRSARFQAPEMLRPTNRWASRDALTKDFNAERDKTAAYIRETKDDLRGHAGPHPVLKSLDGYQWVLLIAAHSARHTAQIEEVKTAAGYPKQ